MRLSGRIGSDDREGRFNVEADLSAMKIDNLLPGWIKPPGRPARAAFTLVKEKTGVRFDDFLVDGQGITGARRRRVRRQRRSAIGELSDLRDLRRR